MVIGEKDPENDVWCLPFVSTEQVRSNFGKHLENRRETEFIGPPSYEHTAMKDKGPVTMIPAVSCSDSKTTSVNRGSQLRIQMAPEPLSRSWFTTRGVCYRKSSMLDFWFSTMCVCVCVCVCVQTSELFAAWPVAGVSVLGSTCAPKCSETSFSHSVCLS